MKIDEYDAGEEPDEQRQREVLQRIAPMIHDPTTSSESTGSTAPGWC